jgi:ABC-2 type transport system ATP-binding protein
VVLTSGAPVVEARDLTKRYGEVLAVDRISFAVDRGEIVALLGPNGAGKSTTMRILTCFMPATSGEAKVAGFDIWSESLEVRRRLGYMPENMPLYTEMRVREYLDFRARLKGVHARERRRRIEEVAERCWVSDVLGRIIGQLSKGYRQRVGLAECLIHDPEILILDEPTIGLDPAQIRETRRLIREVGEDRTVILSTHILPEAEMVSNRVLIIHQGRLVPEEEIARMRAASTVVVEARGDRGRIEAALRGAGGVTRLRHLDFAEGEGVHRFEVEGAGGGEAREAISRRLVEAGLPPREVKPVGADLEEVFVRITAQDRPA